MTKIQELKALLEAGSSDLCFYSDQVWPEIIGSWRMTGAFGLYKKLQTGDVASTVDYQDDHTGLIVHVNTQDMLNSCVSQGDDYQAVWGKITAGLTLPALTECIAMLGEAESRIGAEHAETGIGHGQIGDQFVGLVIDEVGFLRQKEVRQFVRQNRHQFRRLLDQVWGIGDHRLAGSVEAERSCRILRALD